MLKNKLFLSIVAIFCSFLASAQSIEIDDARFDLPAGFSYAAGGSVAIPFKVNNGCLPRTNSFNAVLCNATGTPITGANATSVTLNEFYTTFINVTLPATLPAGTYTLRISTNAPTSLTDLTNPFTVTTGTSVNAMAVPVNRNVILRDQYYYGRCDGAYVNNMILIDSSNGGNNSGIDSFELIDDYRTSRIPQKFVPNASGNFNLTFTPTEIGSTSYFRDAYYTGIAKSIIGNVVSTKAYHIINNNWAIQIRNIKLGTTTPSSCKGDTVRVRVQLDTTQILNLYQNFPGAIINVNWGEFPTEDYTICQIINNGGILKHFYSQSSCERTNTPNFNITATVTNPFNVINGPGITGTCGPGAQSNTTAQLFAPPKAKFKLDSVVCGNSIDSLLLDNQSDPGQASANTGLNGIITNCAKLGSYTWIIDGVTSPRPYYQTPIGRVEPVKDTSRKFTPAEAGYHDIKLIVSNAYGDDAPCPTSDTTARICVDTGTITPMFMLDSAALGTNIKNDSIIGCAPVIRLANSTRRTFCLDSTQFNYIWRVHDATKPFNRNDTIRFTPGGDYSFLSNTNSRSRVPIISINKTGKYYISLSVRGKCDTSVAIYKYVEANGDAGVTFRYDTVFNCGAPGQLQISYDSTIRNNNLFARISGVNTPIDTNKPNYNFQASAAGTLKYKWTVTGGTRPTDWDFVAPTNDTVAHPVFIFKTKGIYAVTDTFKNSCATKFATQIVNFQEPPSLSPTLTNVDTICRSQTTFTVYGFGVDTTKNNRIRITWSSPWGTFSPSTGTITPSGSTPNILTPEFTPNANALTTSCPSTNTQAFPYTMTVSSITNPSCTTPSATRNLFITPCIPSSDVTINICNGTPVNYIITSPPNTQFSYVRSNVINVTGTTPGALGVYVNSITDVLSSPTTGEANYTIRPKLGVCEGDPYNLKVNVRPNPSGLTITRNYPSNSPIYSMCSGEAISLSLSSNESSDRYSWTSYSVNQRNGQPIHNQATLFTNQNNQANFNPEVIINTGSINDTVWYVFDAISSYGCLSTQRDSVFVIITPGPPPAKVVNNQYPDRLVLCDSSCLTFRGNHPSSIGLASWELVSMSPSNPQVPTFTTIAGTNDSAVVICDIQKNTDYFFRYKIEPALPGCRPFYDTFRIYVADTNSIISGLRDTVVCDVTGTTLRNFPISAQSSRPFSVAGQLLNWYINPNSSSSSSITPTGLLTGTYNFRQTGNDTILFCAENGICPTRCDTSIIRLFGLPIRDAVAASPIMPNNTYCQGSDITFTASSNPVNGDIQSWNFIYYTSSRPTDRIVTTQNPYIYTSAQEPMIIKAIYRSRGWDYGCLDSSFAFDIAINVDSPSRAGKIQTNDTIICIPGSTATLNLTNYRGSKIEWIRSTTGCNGPWGPTFNLGPTAYATVFGTTWFRAIVTNGNCPSDTTACQVVFIPTPADDAKARPDTAICGIDSFRLIGNVPAAGNGYWKQISGPVNTSSSIPGVVTLDASNNYQVFQNPVLINTALTGTYGFVYTIQSASCDGSADTIIVVNTQPISNNNISPASDTVCKGTQVTLIGSVPIGGGATKTYRWERSTNNGLTWTLVGTNANSYTFPGDTTSLVRRIIKSDSCVDISNQALIVVHTTILNNTITAPAAVCTGTLSATVFGSTPIGGNNTYSYTWDTANSRNSANGIWTNVTTANGTDYNPNIILSDTLCFRRIVSSGECRDTSASVCSIIYPDAKATFITYSNDTLGCAPFRIPILQAPLSTTITYVWYADSSGVRIPLGSGAGFPGYTFNKSLDSVKITLIATSTLGCKSDSSSQWYYTQATPIGGFTVSQDTGCSNTSGVNTTTFNFTNTTQTPNLFSYIFNYGDGTSVNLTNPILNPPPKTFAPNTRGLDTVYNVCLTALSVNCGSNTVCKPIRIRTTPKVIFSVSPSAQCSGGIVNFADNSVAVNASTLWNFDDAVPATTSTSAGSTSFIYNDTVLTTRYPKLYRQNECGIDSFSVPVTIISNTVTLNVNVKAGQQYQCNPSTVTFYSFSRGGTSYTWDFGDGQVSLPSVNGIDSITHTYTLPGKYYVTLIGSTGCGSVVKRDSIIVYGTPKVDFSITNPIVCKGDTIRLTNLTDTATSYIWRFSDGTSSGIANPGKSFVNAGNYSIKLIAIRNHTTPLGPLPNCIDSSGFKTVTVRDSMPGSFTKVLVGSNCLPANYTLTNTSNIPTGNYTTNWFFTPSLLPLNGNTVLASFAMLGQYQINMVSTNTAGCVYTDSQNVRVSAPFGTWQHDTGYVCGNTTVNFKVFGNTETDSVIIDYGDGVVSYPYPYNGGNDYPHVYQLGNTYFPTVTLKSSNGCNYFLNSFGAVRVDYVDAKYTLVRPTPPCGSTTINFVNNSTMDQTPSAQTTIWTIDGNIDNNYNATRTYTSSGTHTVKLVTRSISGCEDSVDLISFDVKVNNFPTILSFGREKDTTCSFDLVKYQPIASTIEDPITQYSWRFGNGETFTSANNIAQTIYSNTSNLPVNYRDTLIVSTQFCSTTLISPNALVVNPNPSVSISPSATQTICLGDTLTLTGSGSGVVRYAWSPNFNIIGSNSTQSIRVNPTDTARYLLIGTNVYGCTDSASVSVNVIQPYTISIKVTPNDSVCKGTLVTLEAKSSDGRLRGFKWDRTDYFVPDTLNPANAIITILPLTNITYRVVDTASTCPGPDGRPIFGEQAIAVGDSFNVSFVDDSISLQAGTKYTFNPSYGNEPMASYVWTPNSYFTQLNGSTTPNPEIEVTDNMCYNVEATSLYGCKSDATICIRAFCEASQVFIPNAFTPDGNGINDYFYVTANGINKVVSFRVFNRWGQVVFERAGYQPAPYRSQSFNPNVAWDGKFKGVIAPTDTYVYTCEVECANGTRFTYTGSVSLIK